MRLALIEVVSKYGSGVGVAGIGKSRGAIRRSNSQDMSFGVAKAIHHDSLSCGLLQNQGCDPIVGRGVSECRHERMR